ncbi:molybdopterin-binding oxidoreductase [Halobiforma lacisalsi AJ5]|uniref:Molybdopterin-binding oxidoreductase n=1 Tax=Natronobacterium lacisalsi AJ5 TaxID=358396 RepID=M0LR26_NATLA|nr:sulfite oxidase [Halobiforma lacisalsi]APW96874.1 molybdopterin-binding oxidoreductase [Halobiforma lacisalsi AJ5]EMA34904.1 sulfite oxidase [Halobiforma lacisalsi AJ5]
MQGETTDANDERAGEKTKRRQFLDRRKFMAATGMLAGLSITGQGVGAQEMEEDDSELERGSTAFLEERYPGLRIYSPDPENAEAAVRDTYTSYITPREEHYIRNHYLSPEIDEDEWEIELRLEEGSTSLTMDEIRRDFSTESVAHTMQCSGNGRSFFEPEVAGNPWTFGAVGNTIWTGTPMSEVLEAYGADTGDGKWLMVAGGDVPDEESDVFARSIPMQKVVEDCLLAYEMNGQPLSAEHGFPVRMLVPGWMGNNNVKWVAEMEVMDGMMIGEEWERYTRWQHSSYRILAEGQDPQENERIDIFDTRDAMDAEAAGEIDWQPYIYDQTVKSIIGYPGQEATVTPRSSDGNVEVIGVAWAGDDQVEAVEVSTDGGDNWEEAEFFGPDLGPFGWRQFRYLWDAEPGEYFVVSRATDERGRTQPREISDPEDGLRTIQDDQFPWEAGGYLCNAYEPHGVDVTIQ